MSACPKSPIIWRVRFFRNAILSLVGECPPAAVPGIQCFRPFQVHLNHTAAHQFDQRAIQITTLNDGDQRVEAPS